MYGAKKFLLSTAGALVLGLMVVVTVSCMIKQKTEEFNFPRPTGKFDIETVVYHWVDKSRMEKKPRKVGPRELMVQIWYPAEGTLPKRPVTSFSKDCLDSLMDDVGISKSKKELDKEVISGLEQSVKEYQVMTKEELAKILIDFLRKRGEKEIGEEIKTKEKKWFLEEVLREMKFDLNKNKERALSLKKMLRNGEKLKAIGVSYARKIDVSKAKISFELKQFPVVIFSHGVGAGRDFNSVYCENLASHGYIVVSTDHSYTAHQVSFPDGSKRGFIWLSQNPETFLIESLARVDELVKDIIFVLNQLEIINKKGKFQNRLDLKKVGLFGHSLGGVATVQTCRLDKRIIAGISMDGPLFSKNFAKALAKPFMMMQAENYSENIDDGSLKMCNITRQEFEKIPEILCSGISKMKKDSYRVVFGKTGHNVFSNQAILKEIIGSMIGEKEFDLSVGSANGYFATKRINDYLLAFFNKYLRGVDSELLLGVDFKVYK